MPSADTVDQPISPRSWAIWLRSDSVCEVTRWSRLTVAITPARVTSFAAICVSRTTSGSTMSTAIKATAATATTSAISLARRLQRRCGGIGTGPRATTGGAVPVGGAGVIGVIGSGVIGRRVIGTGPVGDDI